MNLLSRKIVSFLFVASLFVFTNGFAMERKQTLEEQLYDGCEKGDLEELRELLLKYKDIDVNKGNEDGETPLHVACRQGHLEIVKLLLKHPEIDVNKRDKYELSPLHFPCCQGHTEIVKLILKHPKIDVNTGGLFGNPLHTACSNGHPKVVKLLLVFGADPKIKDYEGKASLQIAIESLTEPMRVDGGNRQVKMEGVVLVVECLMKHPGIKVSYEELSMLDKALEYKRGDQEIKQSVCQIEIELLKLKIKQLEEEKKKLVNTERKRK